MDIFTDAILRKHAETTKKHLEERHFGCTLVEDEKEALSVIQSIIKDGDTVSVGGSMTLFETNKKILGPLGVIFTIIGAIVSLIVGGFTLYFYFKKDNPKLEVTTYSEQLITQQRNIDNLRAIYIYKDSLEVNNLWQVKYIIRNIGKKTIVGKGVNSMLIEDGVGYSFSDNANV